MSLESQFGQAQYGVGRMLAGMFVVQGAPVIARAMMRQGSEPSPQMVDQAGSAVAAQAAWLELPPSDHEPYSGAFLRRD